MSHAWWEPAGRSHQEPLTPEREREQVPPGVIHEHYEHPVPVIAMQMHGTWNRPSLYTPAAGVAAGSSSRENGTVRELPFISKADNELM